MVDGMSRRQARLAAAEPPWWKTRAKALMALLGTLTPQAVGVGLAAFGVTDPKWTFIVAGLVSVLAATGLVHRVPNAGDPAAERDAHGLRLDEPRPGA